MKNFFCAINADSIIQKLDEAGFRQTHPRRIIANALARMAGLECDFTIEDLWRSARSEDPTVGRATTFRTVDMLIALGVLDQVSFANGEDRYHVRIGAEHHHHLTCETCRKIIELDTCLPAQFLENIIEKYNFSLSGHRLEIFGECAECQKKIQ